LSIGWLGTGAEIIPCIIIVIFCLAAGRRGGEDSGGREGGEVVMRARPGHDHHLYEMAVYVNTSFCSQVFSAASIRKGEGDSTDD
jgi:hypothetical protein